MSYIASKLVSNTTKHSLPIHCIIYINANNLVTYSKYTIEGTLNSDFVCQPPTIYTFTRYVYVCIRTTLLLYLVLYMNKLLIKLKQMAWSKHSSISYVI